MSNALKGFLFSALIFPGAGQILLTRYLRGAVFFLLASLGGVLCVAAIVRRAIEILQEIAARGDVIDMPRILRIAAEASTSASSLFLKASFVILFCCWLVSVVDAWRIGKEMDRVAAEGKE